MSKSLKSSLLATSFILAGSKYSHSAQIISSSPTSNTVSNSLDFNDDGSIIVIEDITDGSAFVGNNSISNSGSLSSYYNDGIYLYASGDDGARISGNTITNSGTITVDYDNDDQHGIYVYAYSYDGDVSISSNAITNSGTITSYGDAMYLGGNSNNDDVYIAQNVMSNSGSLTSRVEGILYTYGEEGMDFYINADDDARAVGNSIINSGIIDTYGEGIDFGVLGGYAVTVTGNSITSSGKIYSESDGISFYAKSYETNAHVSENTILNSGLIDADGKGIYFGVYGDYNASVSSNTILNSGTIKSAFEGILFDVDADYDNAYVSGNTISNTGLIDAGDDGIHFDVNVYEDVGVTGNVISNAGTIIAGNRGVELAVYTYDGDISFNDNTVSNSGKIYSDDEGILINMDADDSLTFTANTISNSGQIENYDDEGMQIDLHADDDLDFSSNTFSNSGTINADSQGIELELDSDDYLYVFSNSITNSGAIISGSQGIQVDVYGDDGAVVIANLITNSGSITSDGTGVDVFFGSDFNDAVFVENTITNSGTIVTSDDYARGIELRGYSDEEDVFLDNNDVINSGRIETAGASAHGIELFSDAYFQASVANNTVTNSGSISVSGERADAIVLANYSYSPAPVDLSSDITNNTINNSGRLVSAHADAIDISSGAYNTLNLSAPAFIGGYLALGDGDDVNLTSGPSQSNFWTFTGVDFEGPESTTFVTDGALPWFRLDHDDDAVTFATFDPSGVAARTQVLGETASMASGFVQQGLDGFNGSKENYRVWAAGGFNAQNFAGNGSTTLEQNVTTSGGAIGFAGKLGDTMRLALMVGGVTSNVKVDSRFSESQDNSSEGIVGGAFLRHASGGLTLDLGVNGGWSNNNTRRFVNDNLANNDLGDGETTLGNSWNDGEHSSWWVGPEFAAAYKVELLNGMAITPSARVRYAMEHGAAYSETTTNPDRIGGYELDRTASVGAYDASLFEGDFGLTFSQMYGLGRASITGGYIVREANGDTSIDVSMLDDTYAVPVDVSQHNAPYVGAGFMIGAQGRVMLSVDGRAVFADGEVGSGFRASINGSF